MKQDQKDVKLKILDAAKRLFARKGFEGTTVRQICDEAGVALALVSYHFGGKENVYYALFETFTPQFAQTTYDLKDPEADLRSFIRDFVQFRIAEPELINMLQQEVMMQSPRLEKIQSIVYSIWMQLRHILEAGRGKGCFDYESLKHTMHFVFGTLIFSRVSPFLEPVFESDSAERQDESLDAVVAYTTKFIFNGLQCKE